MAVDAAPMEFRDYLQVIKRRKAQLFLPMLIILTLAVVLAFTLPPRYRSEATLLIERQAIPANLVETTVTGYVQERIEQITQRILTYENLLQIAEEHNLYPELMKEDPRKVVLQAKEDFEVAMLDVEAKDPNMHGGAREATIAFTVAFHASDAGMAQKITQQLADRYLTEHGRKRQEIAEEVQAFLEEEATKLSNEIKAMEDQLAEFKQSSLHTLPELMDVNLKLFEKTEAEIDESEERIRELEQNIASLGAEMAVTPAYEKVETETGDVLLSSEQKMNSLVTQYLRASSVYSAKHPDVRRLAREIRVLAEQTGNAGRTDELMNELVSLQERLRQAERTYGPDHPDVRQLERSVAAVQSGFQSALTSTAATERKLAPNNPRYVNLQAQQRAAQASLDAERGELRRHRQKLAEYEKRLFDTPIVESQYSNLQRDLSNAVNKYNDLKNKQIDSKLAQELEAGESGERFSLSEPAYLPKLPDSPNRIGIFLLGFLIAGVSSLAIVALAEYLDKAIHDARAITATLGAPPLAVIPRINSAGKFLGA